MSIFKAVYENGEGSSTGESGNKVTLQELVKKHNLQEELNSIMANNKRTIQQKNEELASQLENIRDQAKMSTQAKEQLEAQIEELKTQHMTAEELAKREADKLVKAHTTELKKLQEDSSRWQDLYAKSTIERALTDAAISGEAIVPSQVVDILRQQTSLVEEVDAAGQGKGNYNPVVKFNDTDGDGKAIVLELSPSKAIERMRELADRYGNLFKGNAVSGLGEKGSTASGKGKVTLKQIEENPKLWLELRKKNPNVSIEDLE